MDEVARLVDERDRTLHAASGRLDNVRAMDHLRPMQLVLHDGTQAVAVPDSRSSPGSGTILAMSIDTDPFSDESLRRLEDWRRTHAARLRRRTGMRGYLYRAAALASVYGLASIPGYAGVPEAMVIVAIAAYYYGRSSARAP